MKQAFLMLSLILSSSGFFALPFHRHQDFAKSNGYKVNVQEQVLVDYTGTDEDGNTDSIDTSKDLINLS
ncbi:MAG: hypothetical protein HC835_03455 [Oscillatoriales cyanobacterium RM2_1_1]|nr:hypothetical protein [Oscillatoriales cyanobacterium SM2_3_0]NJO44749.1 hypothetical protein [Oscillatoriales cyanobacterium RM2_1_1]